MKLKTIRVRRNRPSALSFALALMLTMLCVYILSLSAVQQARQVAAPVSAQADLQLNGLEAIFQCEGRYDNEIDARLAAAHCAQAGGAGLILPQEDQYAVVSHAGSEPGENSFIRSAAGITLRISGDSKEIAALNDAVSLLQALHTETESLADPLMRGDADAASIAALMEIYRTRGERIQNTLIDIQTGSIVISTLLEYTEKALTRIECTQAQPTVSHLRLLHAAACADWISLLETFHAIA